MTPAATEGPDDGQTAKGLFSALAKRLGMQDIEVGGVIRDVAVLKGLFDLFAEVLNTLCHIGSAYENDPQLSL